MAPPAGFEQRERPMSDTPAGQGPWQPPPGGAARRPRNGVGVAALVLGVVALVLAVLILFAPVAALVGLVAVIVGIIGLGRANRGVADNRGQAVTGLICGAIALLLGGALTVSAGTFLSTHTGDFRRLGRCLNDATTDAQRSACAREFSDRLNHR